MVHEDLTRCSRVWSLDGEVLKRSIIRFQGNAVAKAKVTVSGIQKLLGPGKISDSRVPITMAIKAIAVKRSHFKELRRGLVL